MTKYRIMLFLIVFVMVLGVVVFTAAPCITIAEEAGVNFDETDVLNDLTSSTINGVPFDLKDYPFDEDGEMQVVSFIEYCYSYKANMRKNYGLYVYVYNPRAINIATDNKGNKIQMAIKYNANGEPADYA